MTNAQDLRPPKPGFVSRTRCDECSLEKVTVQDKDVNIPRILSECGVVVVSDIVDKALLLRAKRAWSRLYKKGSLKAYDFSGALSTPSDEGGMDKRLEVLLPYEVPFTMLVDKLMMTVQPALASLFVEDTWNEYNGLLWSAPGASAQGWHTDASSRIFPDLPYVAVYIYLQEISKEMGPLQLVPVNFSAMPKGDDLEPADIRGDCDSLLFTPVPMGSIVIYDPRALHRGSEQLSDTKEHRVVLTTSLGLRSVKAPGERPDHKMSKRAQKDLARWRDRSMKRSNDVADEEL